jgi:enoyl-CoA hydratase/carnithine racemase
LAIEDEIHIRVVGRTGRITLCRPKALNALTYDMAMAIEAALDRWQADHAIDMIVIDSEGDKAFCAGGDIAQLHATGSAGDFAYGRKFWVDEYRMNAKIANCRIPYVALMNGFVMGGGVGISAHGSHRIATERSTIAMPECGIGLIPDVGGTYILSRAPGHLGEFLGMTGWRMAAADAILAGFADSFVAADDLSALTAALEATADPSALDSFYRTPGEASLAGHLPAIDHHFGKETALACLRSLEDDKSEFAQKAATAIRRACPLAVACTFEIIRRARSMPTIEAVLALEFRFTYRGMTDGDFLEGVRAQIIAKDRNPRWRIERLEDVTPSQIERMLAPLGHDELHLKWGETA